MIDWLYGKYEEELEQELEERVRKAFHQFPKKISVYATLKFAML